MKRSPSRRARTIATVGGVSIVMSMLLGAGSASAAQPPGPDAPEPSYEQIASLPSSTLLTGETTRRANALNGGVTTLAVPVGVNPNGCVGVTDNPHKSGIYASVHGRTTCTFTSQNLQVTTVLYRHDWFGLNYMADHSSSRTSGTASGDAHPHSSCDYAPSRTYSGVSSHAVTVAGVLYSAATENTKSFACNY